MGGEFTQLFLFLPSSPPAPLFHLQDKTVMVLLFQGKDKAEAGGSGPGFCRGPKPGELGPPGLALPLVKFRWGY